MLVQIECKEVGMGSWLLNLLSGDIKPKLKKTKINQQTMIKNNKKVKEMGNIARSMGHYPRNK